MGRAHIVAVCQSANSTAVCADGTARSAVENCARNLSLSTHFPSELLWPTAGHHPDLTRYCGCHNWCEQMWDTRGRGVCGRKVWVSALEGEGRCGGGQFIGLASVASL